MPPSLPNSNVLDAAVQTVSCGTLCTSCNILHRKVDTLTQRIQELEGANKELSAQLAEQHNVYLMPENKLAFYTGIPKATFLALLAAVVACLPPAHTKMPHSAQLLMVLMKLRLALTYQDLAYRFNIHRHTVSSIFKLWIGPLSSLCANLITFPSPSVAQSWLTKKERKKFPRLRAIIDCTEVKVSRPYNLDTQQVVWRN
ncbi:uncharacterized protein LOC135383784 [Ornithodoros turicata]|uniref:uncharacterized protein LOC135383784 n=1 Tax=Ornithodoros turicata TaxID=34597 RepID=UPI0031397B3B